MPGARKILGPDLLGGQIFEMGCRGENNFKGQKEPGVSNLGKFTGAPTRIFLTAGINICIPSRVCISAKVFPRGAITNFKILPEYRNLGVLASAGNGGIF